MREKGKDNISHNADHVPYVPPGKQIPELTVKAVLLGVLLSIIFGIANVYLGLYAGMTISASIPAAVVSMGILRALRKGTILENNMVQTVASAGESLAAGVIFTIPALVITGAWMDFQYWPTVLVSILGGILGVLFMIPLRRTLISEEEELIYPEGVACAKVLEVGDKGGAGVKYVFRGLLIGLIFKFLISWLKIIKGTVERAVKLGKSIFYFGSEMSVALMGVGYIVGFNIAMLVFLGGLIGWVLGVPIYSLVNQAEFIGMSPLESASTIWSTRIRYMGVGAMVVGGIWSIVSAWGGIVSSIKSALEDYSGKSRTAMILRTEEDLPMKYVLLISIPVIIGILLLYLWILKLPLMSLLATLCMVIMGFFFVAVSSYTVGLVGSSNNPVSGMTICTVLFTAIMILIFNLKGMPGLVATMLVAAVVCIASCCAGDMSQDLKTGHLLGATPKKQQIGEIIGIVIPAFIMPLTLTLLLKAYGFVGLESGKVIGGTPGTEPLVAPQATLFASLTMMIFTSGDLPWHMIGFGALVGILLILIDMFLKRSGSKFRTYPMPVAVGLYLPLGLTVPIFIGGVMKLIVAKVAGDKFKEADHRGILTASGLISGEALMGVIVAILLIAGIRIDPILESDLVSVVAFLIPCVLLVLTSLFGKGE
ncbi:MAG: oligopeptide transporter, OPT family [Candidatus Hydrothermia bacterium]